MPIARLLLFSILIGFGIPLLSQDRIAITALQQKLRTDSSAAILVELAREWMSQKDSATSILRQAKLRAKEQGDSVSLAFTHLYEAQLLQKDGLSDSAQKAFEASFLLSESLTPALLKAERQAYSAIQLHRTGDSPGAIKQIKEAEAFISLDDPLPHFPLLLAGAFISFGQGNIRESQWFSQKAESLIDGSTPKRIQAQVLNNLGNVYTHLGQPDLGECYLQSCLDLRNAIDDWAGQTNTLMNLSVLKNRTGDTQSAINLTHKSIQNFHLLGDTLAEASGYQNLGIYYRTAGKTDSAHIFLDLAWQLYLTIGREDRTANVLNSKALIYQDEGNYPASLQLFFEALKQARANGQKPTEGLCLANIARVLQELGMVKESEPYAAGAWEILKETQEFIFKGGLYRELGQYHRQQGNWGKADSSFAYVVRMGESSQNTTLQAEGWLGLSSTKLDQRLYSDALSIAQRAESLLPPQSRDRIKIKLEGNLAQAHAGLHQVQEAVTHAALWAKLAQEAGLTQELADALKLRSELAGLTGDYRNAHAWGSQSAHLQDSLSGATRQRTLAGLQAVYDLREKQYTIRALREDLALSELQRDRQALRVQRSRLFGAIIALALLLLGTLLFFVMRRNILRRKAENLQLQLTAARQRTEMESQLRSVQQQALQTRMNPHFTFNCLNSIQACILRQDQDAATLYLAQFARLVRQAFEFADLEAITVEQELAFLTLYCELENLRFSQRVKVTLDVDPSVDPEIAMVPPLILQPLVENAFQHAFPPSIQAPHISIRVSHTSTHQIWIIQDNGIGPQPAEPTKFGMERTPSGIAKTRERLALLRNAEGQSKAEMEVKTVLSADEKIAGTQVVVQFQFGQ